MRERLSRSESLASVCVHTRTCARWSKHAVLLELRLLVYQDLSVSVSPPPLPRVFCFSAPAFEFSGNMGDEQGKEEEFIELGLLWFAEGSHTTHFRASG